MELFLKIAMAAILILLLVRLWPVFKHWQEKGPKAQAGDWWGAILPLGAVAALVVLLILAVR